MIPDNMLSTYEAICDHARHAREELDGWRWVIGDDACTVEKQYGQDMIAEFAKDVGLNKSTADSYRRVSKFYPKNRRVACFEAYPNLTYAYYKDAARCGDIDEALLWLDEVSSNGWTADEASHKLTERLGRSSTRAQAVTGVVRIDGSQTVIDILDPCDWQPGDLVKVTKVAK